MDGRPSGRSSCHPDLASRSAHQAASAWQSTSGAGPASSIRWPAGATSDSPRNCQARGRHVTLIDWLLDSDPAIRWQVMRDLTHESASAVADERAKVATQGWGARLLSLQAGDGRWGGGAAIPDAISTNHTLWLLRFMGLDPA